MSSQQPRQQPQRRGPWSKREDEQLKFLVDTQGASCWVRVSLQIQTRSAKQCRERYHQNLKPTLDHSPISPEEGAHIERMVEQIGRRWAEIARSLKNRSDNAVKNWWNGSMNRRKRMVHKPKTSGVHSGNDSIHPFPQRPLPPLPPLASPYLHTVPPHSAYPHRYDPASPSYHTRFHPWPNNSGLPSPSTSSSGVEPLYTPDSLRSDPVPLYTTTAATTATTTPAAAAAAVAVRFPGRFPESNARLPPLRIHTAASPISEELDRDPRARPPWISDDWDPNPRIRPPGISEVSDPDPRIRPPGITDESLRLPRIGDAIPEYRQLLTAPNSPLGHSPAPAQSSPRNSASRYSPEPPQPQQSIPQAPAREKETGGRRSGFSIRDILS
ncbi:Homeodomain-like protein [Hypoxylon crocopeplum]|nr:Homeodomain-like protein [Hypoxylon crocopeplum]